MENWHYIRFNCSSFLLVEKVCNPFNMSPIKQQLLYIFFCLRHLPPTSKYCVSFSDVLYFSQPHSNGVIEQASKSIEQKPIFSDTISSYVCLKQFFFLSFFISHIFFYFFCFFSETGHVSLPTVLLEKRKKNAAWITVLIIIIRFQTCHFHHSHAITK